MFYFTCNESKIYESFTFWNKLQENVLLFHDILIYWDAPVNVFVYIICVCAVYIYYVYINTNTCMYIFKKKIVIIY